MRVFTPVDDFNVHQQMTPTHADYLDPTNPDTTDADAGDCGYNFFDELDTRLANLRSTEGGSEKTGS